MVFTWVLAGCVSGDPGDGPEVPEAPEAPEATASEADAPEDDVVISVVGTTDLHGQLAALPILGAYFDNLRAAREDDGGVVLVDAGDVFQGTLESNLNRGKTAIAAYGELGYDAVAIGNHEFDFGPDHDAPTPQDDDDDPRGALKERAKEAAFPLLAANLADEGGGRVDWENVPAATVVDVAGVSVGIIGATTTATPYTTIAMNFEGLEVWDLLPTVRAKARELRASGASVVVLAAHAGGRCSEFSDPDDLESCDEDSEIFELARQLPAGLVDVIAAGHTHAGVAHRVNDTAIVQSYANGAGFSRVDVTVRPSDGEVVDVEIHQPQVTCEDEDGDPAPASECDHDRYEGRPLEPSPSVAAIVDEAVEEAEQARSRALGVTLSERLETGYASESPVGNLFADLMREAMPEADIAITNGGGVRADLPQGELTYGELHRAAPFDNQFSQVTLTGGDLAELLRRNLGRSSGILLLSGAEASARCEGGHLEVELRRGDGARIADDEELVVATSDFLAPGEGRGLFGRLDLDEGAITSTGQLIRAAKAERLEARGEVIRRADVYDPDSPRLAYPGSRPVECGDG